VAARVPSQAFFNNYIVVSVTSTANPIKALVIDDATLPDSITKYLISSIIATEIAVIAFPAYDKTFYISSTV